MALCNLIAEKQNPISHVQAHYNWNHGVQPTTVWYILNIYLSNPIILTAAAGLLFLILTIIRYNIIISVQIYF